VRNRSAQAELVQKTNLKNQKSNMSFLAAIEEIAKGFFEFF